MSAATAHIGVHDATIRMANGHYWDYKRPGVSLIDIETVATSLSNTCRFTGHISSFYSVAQHCVLASFIVPPAHALMALGHEPEEPVTGDMNKPLKVLLEEMTEGRLSRFVKEQERPILSRVFGLDPYYPKPDTIKQADLRLLATEKRDLGPNHRVTAWDERGFACEWEPMPKDEWTLLQGIEPLGFRIHPWSPFEARKQFLHRYVQLRFGGGPGPFVEQEGLLRGPARCAGCDLLNGCPEFCKCKPAASA